MARVQFDPGTTGWLTGQKSLCILLRNQEQRHFLLVNRLVVPGLPPFQHIYVLKVYVPFSCLIPRKIIRIRGQKKEAVPKGSSISWVAKFKRDNHLECKLSNGWSQSYREIKLLLQENERSRSYREINQHSRLPWDFIAHGFLDPFAFLKLKKLPSNRYRYEDLLSQFLP